MIVEQNIIVNIKIYYLTIFFNFFRTLIVKLLIFQINFFQRQ